MFPNVSQHAARWELERNGGSVERAVERALREGGLPEVSPGDAIYLALVTATRVAESLLHERHALRRPPCRFPETPRLTLTLSPPPQPPASYNPPSAEAPRATGPVPPTTPVRAAPAPQASTPAGAGARGKPPSLIARMGLQAQVAADVKGRGKATDEDTGSSSGWSPKAEEREKNLRARKQKLVLEARRSVRFPGPSLPRHPWCSRNMSIRVISFERAPWQLY